MMYYQRLVAIKCNHCGYVHSMDQGFFLELDKYQCDRCKRKALKRDLNEYQECVSGLNAQESGFNFSIQIHPRFSLLDVMMRAQDHANNALIKRRDAIGLNGDNFYEHLQNPDLLHTYMLNLTRGAIKEYHQQLRAAFAEKGIELDQFEEVPLCPSKDGLDES